jgi:hypothetical protein
MTATPSELPGLPEEPKLKTFKEWWHECGGRLPTDITRREVAITAWSAAMEQIDALRSRLDRYFKLRIEAELRADRAESALREAREKERERCIEKCEGIASGEVMSKHISQQSCASARHAITKCIEAIRSMTDEQK